MYAKFKITKNNIKAQFAINKPQIPAVFKINAIDVYWGRIRGNIKNQADLQDELSKKADITFVETELNAVDARLESIEDSLPEIEEEIDKKPNRDELAQVAFTGDYNDLTVKATIGDGTLTLKQNGDVVGDFKANAINNTTWELNTPTKLSQLENDINAVNTNQLNNAISVHNTSEDAHSYIQGLVTNLDEKYTTVTEGINSAIGNANDRITANANNITTVNNNLTALGQLVNENYDTLNENILNTEEELSNDILATSNALNNSIQQEATNRANADDNLQSQIDGITAGSDVTDIVGTYAQLQQYDTSKLTLNDIVKVLNDETHNNASSYYRWNGTTWTYIGSEGPFYTKSEANSTFVPQTRTINNKALTNNINLTAADVKALPDTTVIGNGSLTVQKNGVNIANFSANETTNVVANISVPTSVSELTNDANYVTSNQLETGLNAKQDKLTAGTGIEITAENVINSTAVTEWGEIQGELSNQEDLQNALNLKANISSLANVATSGNYNDLSNKPTIPTTTSQLTNDSRFITDANLTPLRTDITSLQTDKQDKLTAGENITIENNVISASGGIEKYGIKGDYSTHYGIEYCQYGLIEYTLENTITVKGGMVLCVPGADTKTTIASDINYDVMTTTDFTLFYADGSLLEALDVVYSIEEPTNGTDGFIAWFNPEVGVWQFKSNDTGNVWREASATPLADIKFLNGNIVRVDYIGYRILNDDIYALKSDIPTVVDAYTKEETNTLLDAKQNVISDLSAIRSGAEAGATAVQPEDLAQVATTGDYEDLTNKPTIPVVNDGTLTIQANGVDVATFTANQATNTIANISIPDSATWGNITGTLSNQTDLQNALNTKQNVINDLDTIRSGASLGTTSLQSGDNITELNNNAGYLTSIPAEYVTETELATELNDYAKKSEIPEGSIVDDAFSTTSTNAVQNKVVTAKFSEVEASIPTTTSDLTNDSGFITDANLTPLRTDITSLQTNKQDKLTAGTGIEITAENVINYTAVTEWGNIQGDITQQADLQNEFNTKQNTISDLETIRINASNGATALNTINTYGDIVTHNVSEFATSAQGGLADSALQPGDNITELVNNAGYITSADLPTKLSEFTNDTNFQNATQVNSAISTHNSSQTAHTDIRNLINDLQTQVDDNAGDIAVLEANKQDVLTAGENITIENNVISATGGEDVDLTNYYTKDETYSQEEVDTLLDEKEDKITTVEPLSLGLETVSPTVGMVFTENNTKISPSVATTFTNQNDIVTLGGQTWENQVSYIAIPYTIGDLFYIPNTNGSSGSRWYTVLGKRLETGEFVPMVEFTSMRAYHYGYTTLYLNKISANSYSVQVQANGYTWSNLPTGAVGLLDGGTTWNIITPTYYNYDREVFIELDKTTTTIPFDEANEIRVYGDNISLAMNIRWILHVPASQVSMDMTLTNMEEKNDFNLNPVTYNYMKLKYDNQTIQVNSEGEIQTIGVIDNNTSNAIKTWTGTRAEYDAIVSKDANTLYNITDDTDVTLSLLELLYPVGSIYIGTMANCPLATLGVGTWQLVASDRVLQGAGTRGSVGTTVNESLPNITGEITIVDRAIGGASTGAFYSTNISNRWANWVSAGDGGALNHILDASRSSSTYQNNAPVQQDAYLVNIWERIS